MWGAGHARVVKALPRTRSCFVCGVANPLGFRLVMHTDGRLTEARFQFRTEHVGFRDTIHGGLIATILDELMVWACGVATGRFAYCAEMTVRYRKPVLPEIPVLAQAELVNDGRGRLLLARATLRDGNPDADTVFAESTGKYLPMTSDLTSFVGGDFIDDPASVLRLPKLPG